QTTRFLGLLSCVTLTREKYTPFDLGFHSSRDIHRHTTHSDWTTLITNNDRLRLNPNFAPVFVHPAKPARTAFALSKDRSSFSSRTLFIIGMNYRQPEVGCR